MRFIKRLFSTSIGRKQVMAVSGLLLSLFLIGHLSGNLLLYVGADAFNKYAGTMMANPLLVPIEIVLIAILLIHMAFAFVLTLENRRARPERYAVKHPSEASMASRTMIYSGILVFAFLILHLVNFKFGDYEDHPQFLYGLVVDYLSQPLNGSIYIICMVVLGLHLKHAIQSVFQSFGWNHPSYTPSIKRFCTWLGVLIAVGFGSFPIWAMLTKGGV